MEKGSKEMKKGKEVTGDIEEEDLGKVPSSVLTKSTSKKLYQSSYRSLFLKEIL